jgi:alpha-glucosidase
MLNLKSSDIGFQIIFKNEILIEHSLANPAFKIGVGKSQIKMRHGNFKIKEKIIKEIELKQFEIEKITNDEISIKLLEIDYVLNLIFKLDLIEKRLEIFPKVSKTNINRFWMKIKSDPSENIFGCGARFSEFNLQGKKIPLWVEDATPLLRQGRKTYFPQTLFLSLNQESKYFCYFETTSYSEFDFSSDHFHIIYIWSIPKKIIIGKFNTSLEVVKSISDYFGRQPRLPEWVYDGLILGIQGGNETVEEKINTAKNAGITLTGVWCQDWQGIRITSMGQQLFWNWQYDGNRYPNLPEYIEKLHDWGIKFLGYMGALLNIEGNQYEEALNNEFLLNDKNKSPLTIRSSDFRVGIIDFSNKHAIEWFKEIMKEEMIKIGLDGWMVDYGEYCDPNSHASIDLKGEDFHNYYPILYAKAVYYTLKEMNRLKDIFVFHRTGYNNSIPYMMCYWAGDQLVNWDKDLGLPSVIPCGLSIGLGGVGNYYFDIGGFLAFREIKRTKEIFMRWVELGTFSLVMRTHEGNKPQENWQFDSDKETLEHLSKMVNIHIHLKPYLKHLEEEYQKCGIPPMRPCFLYYENDKNLYNIKFQYLLGRDLLIAPVIEPNKKVWEVYLPEDNWIHLWNGKSYKGGLCEVKSPLGELPVFFRSDSPFKKIFLDINKFHRNA